MGRTDIDQSSKVVSGIAGSAVTHDNQEFMVPVIPGIFFFFQGLTVILTDYFQGVIIKT